MPISFAAPAAKATAGPPLTGSWDTGIKKTSLQNAIKALKARKLIAVYKHRNPYGYSNNEYHLLSLDNPEVYRDLTPPEELPLGIYDELPA